MSSGCLFDASFVVSFLREVEYSREGDALRFLSLLRRGTKTYLSVVAYAEVLEHAADVSVLAAELRSRFQLLGISQDVAERVALMQTRSARRMGENDAWIAATAAKGGLTLVGDDDDAFGNRPQFEYVNFRRFILK